MPPPYLALLLAPAFGPQDFPDLPLGALATLPTVRAVEEQVAAGDEAWIASLEAPAGDRAGLRRTAFDAWQGALQGSEPGAAVRVVLPGAEGSPFLPQGPWDPSRAAEGAQEAVLRRLASVPSDGVEVWIARFTPQARAALAEALAAAPDRAAARLAEVERRFPLTRPSVAAAIACADLALEEARHEVAGTWLVRASRQLEVHARASAGPGADREWLGAVRRGIEARRATIEGALAPGRMGRDHTAPRRPIPLEAAPRATPPELTLLDTYRIAGIERSASDPFGRGLSSGLAGLGDGAVLVQGAPGLLLIEPRTEAGGSRITRALTGEALGIGRVFPRALASAGGWPSLPATDGVHVAVVAGRAERPRAFLDLKLAPIGNALGVVVQGGAERAIRPRWVLRDGRVLMDPTPSAGPRSPDQLATLRRVKDVPGWDMGPGWEWQPGPVIAGGAVYALARGLGDPRSSEGADRADEVRLFALDLDTAEVLWSREVTSERGRSEDRGRGDAAAFAVTTMPLGIHRPSGTLYVGTNAGLVCAFGAAEGRLLWAARTQRGGSTRDGWAGSQPPIVVIGSGGGAAPGAGDAVWMTPLGSEFAYSFVAGPWPLDAPSPLAERPRPRRGALSIAAVHPPARAGAGATLALLGREGRYDAILLDTPGETRIPATYLAPSERFGGHAAQTPFGLLVAGTGELVTLDGGQGYGIAGAAPLRSRGAGRGGDVLPWRGRVYVVGRDTVWILEATR
ncbi:MAG: hypothetical protein VX460_06545 [Planctomycetota bacterium]|nr:hypothetical protein [Planctomycetota bacterium]